MSARYRLQHCSVTVTPAEYLPPDPSRRYLLIQNQGPGDLFVSFDTPASNGLWIPMGDAWEPPIPPANRIGLASESAAHVIIVEC